VARDDRGRVLLVRQRGGPFKGEWLLPGGGLENGETFEQAMRREVLEETGLSVQSAREVARYDVRKGDFHGEVALYEGRVTAGEPRVGPDGEECAWAVVDGSAHGVLLRELLDAKATEIPEHVVAERLERDGVAMRRL
jgi:ADP-ribose pyrophosphatase YjhB (NUDIX family)